MTTAELALKWGLSYDEIERLRRKHSGTYHYEIRSQDGVLKDRGSSPNLVTNEGLNHILTATLDGGTQITAWYVALVVSNTTPLATHTYAVPGFTEATGTEVSEAVRQAWTGGTVASQSVDNSASPATYTADTTFTAYGAALVGGGAAATTLANTAGGGTLYSFSLFSASKAMTASDTIAITYTFTMADDGV